ncbi:MAG: carbohydrate binding family 9 domain-containing protein, partial [Vicinamibacterales bacterium]
MRFRLAPLVICLTLIPGVSARAAAQPPSSAVAEPDVPEKIGKNLRALRVDAAGAPRVDGRLDDQAWVRADRIDDFVQVEPNNMARSTERTIVQVAYDARYLYIAVRCEAADPSRIRSGLGRRDNLPDRDRINIGFDPRHDHQTGYVFEVNASGVQGDFTLYDDTNMSADYDAVWDAATQIDSAGWSAELRIPFSQMRFDVGDGESAVWGLNVARHVVGTGEESRWVTLPRGAIGNVSRFGHLNFGERLTPPR